MSWKKNSTLSISDRLNNKSDEKLDKITKTVEDKIDDINRKFDAKSIELENK